MTDPRDAAFFALAVRETLAPLSTDDLIGFCDWDNQYNVPEAFENASREELEAYWIDCNITIEDIQDLLGRFAALDGASPTAKLYFGDK